MLSQFEHERRRLFAIAYRMLGSVRDAEDILQDAFVRWQAVRHDEVDHPGAYLARLVTRLCIDTLRSARHRREEYVGPWLPEPLLEASMDAASPGPAELGDLADDLSTAFLLMLERLSPVERAVFLLRESFDFSYREIAEVVGKSAENCRQIERRARARIAEGGRPQRPDPAVHDRLLRGFLEATRAGDVDGLLQLLADDVVSYSDGGGLASAARRPVEGAVDVSRFFTGLLRKAPPSTEFRLAPVNGSTGLMTYVDGKLLNVLTIQVENDRIQRIFVVVNPEKLPTPG